MLLTTACGRNDGAPNLLLISIDDLRSDHVGVYGSLAGASPNIDRIAGRGTLFRDTSATAPWTLTSHMSIFTSLHPVQHQVDRGPRLDNGRNQLSVLSERFTTLGERMKHAGYRTGAFTNGAYVAGDIGFARGIDYYYESREIDAIPSLNREFLAWLQAQEGRKFFAFIHTFGVHIPLMPPEEHIEAVTTEVQELHEFGLGELSEVNKGHRKVTPALTKQVKTLYDAELHYVDEFIGGLEAMLDEMGLLDQTLIVITSDHGEEFQERGRYGHGATLYEEVLRVPLIFAGPGVAEGARIDTPVSTLDIMPTILELLELPPEAGISGQSLRAHFAQDSSAESAGENDETRMLFAETTRKRGLVSLRIGHYKAIYDRNDGSLLLFDLSRDRDERVDLANSEAERANRMRELILAHLTPGKAGDPDGGVLPIDRELREQLEALGYGEE